MANKNMPAGTSSLDEGEERTSAELDADLAEDADMAMKGLTEPLPTNQQVLSLCTFVFFPLSFPFLY